MVLGKDLTVMQVRPNYSIVYQFKPRLRLRQENVDTKSVFVKFIKNLTLNWKDGEYFFRSPTGTFCYFVLTGRRVSLFKKSKITGKEYLCWDYFGEEKKKVRKKVKKKVKKVKKKTVKKKVKKKVKRQKVSKRKK